MAAHGYSPELSTMPEDVFSMFLVEDLLQSAFSAMADADEVSACVRDQPR
jgi:hypothetical protein